MVYLELMKMLMNEDFRNNFINVLIGSFLFAIAYFAWRSTSIREQPHYHTVLLLERRLRRRSNRTRLTTHIQSASIVTGVQADVASGSGETPSLNNAQTIETNKPPEGSTSSSSEDTSAQDIERVPTGSTFEEQEIEAIVEIMDADANEVRRRRLAYYDNRQQGVSPTYTPENINDAQNITPVTETMEHPESNANELLMEHNYAEREIINNVNTEPNDVNKNNSEAVSTTPSDSIRIKLKYLNDDLKLVDGRLEEQLGDFKRRHFHLEFSSNKLVRLIFNGQVLQPDSETLKSCGLFDNCVVHCLIHQQRNVPFESNTHSANTGTTSSSSYSGNNNNNQGREWDLGNVLFALVSLILTSAWYFRYEYAYLYNVTATVALVAITGIFTIFLVGVYFPDNEQARVPRQ